MCEHLLPLETELKASGIKETFRGQAWGDNCREWVYFDCYFDIKSLRKRFQFPEFVTHHANDDPRSGLEEGFYCERCKDAVIGLHSGYRMNDEKPLIK